MMLDDSLSDCITENRTAEFVWRVVGDDTETENVGDDRAVMDGALPPAPEVARSGVARARPHDVSSRHGSGRHPLRNEDG